MGAGSEVEHRLVTESEAAKFLRISPKTLESWRTRGGGPRFVRLRGRAIRYRTDDLAAFIVSGIRTSTSDAGSQGLTPGASL